MNLHKIETGNLMLDGGAFFGVVPKSIWSKKYSVNENNLCNLCMRCLLIETENRLILIDCGMGNTMSESLLKFYFINGEDTLENSLKNIQISPNQITDVVFTHLHFDHCGGAITKHPDESLTLTFPNAQYWIGKDHWDSALKPNRRERPSFLKENIEPLRTSGKLNLIEKNTFLTKDIELRLFNGHTAGQIVPIITYKENKLVYTGDFIPSAAHIPISFVCGYDIEPILTMEETEEFLKEAVENNYTLFFEHDLEVECCSLVETPKGIVMNETFTLQDFRKK